MGEAQGPSGGRDEGISSRAADNCNEEELVKNSLVFHLREISRVLFRNYASRPMNIVERLLRDLLKRKDISGIAIPLIVRFDICLKKKRKKERKGREVVIIFLSSKRDKESSSDYLSKSYAIFDNYSLSFERMPTTMRVLGKDLDLDSQRYDTPQT